MSDSTDASIHNTGDIPDAPPGWVGGDLLNTGGGIYAREWIHPEQSLRIGYSVTEPEEVAVEAVELPDGMDASNPLNWRFVETRESRSCSTEQECLEVALELLAEYGTGDSS